MVDHVKAGFSPELMAPAGDREKLETALAYGADAVYLGGLKHNLRTGARGFSWKELGRALALVRQYGKKAYFCLNALPRESQIRDAQSELERLADFTVDGPILADPGLLRLARRLVPHLPVHLSTQANTSNSQAVLFWRDQGVGRINLARELTSRDIKAIRQACPEVELEVFVHGAMCLALSGKCSLSAYLNDRSANQGSCTHPCRFAYRVGAVALEEAKRPGLFTWEVHESGRYSAVLASQDLCLVKHLGWFAANRIDALKIEGRTKSSAYLAKVLDVYRTALQDLRAGGFRPGSYLDELSEAAARPLDSGFFLPGGRRRVLEPPERRARPVVGRIAARLDEDCWLIAVKHRWPAGASLEALLPGLRRPGIQPGEYHLEDETGRALEVAHSGQWARMRCSLAFLEPGFFLRLAGGCG